MTSPRTNAALQRRRRPSQEIDDQTAVGDAYMRSLIRSQLRLALLVLGVLGVTIGALPATFALLPEVRSLDVAGVPLAWVVLGAVVYPVLVALGWFFVRHAEATEDDFADLVERE